MNSNSNSNPFWDFLNEAYRNGPGGASGQRGGPGRRGPQHNGGDFQNWQDMFANGFPFGPMPHRGRHGPPPPHPPPPGAYPPPPHPPPGPHEAHGSRPVSPPPRPSTPPTPPEELPQYPGGGAARRDRSQSPPPQHERSGDEHLPYDRRDARHQRREERRDVRHQERQERQDRRSERRDERNEERRERRESRHYDAFGGPPPFFGGRRGGRHCGRGRGGLPPPIHELLNQLPYLVAQIPHYANQIPGLVGHYFPNGIPTAGTTDAAGRDVPAAEAGLPAGDGSFTIDVDVFSTSEAYLIHAAVPGAKKTDIDVSYDAAKNRVLISGVIQRPAEVDEVMLNSMIEGEREVGLFERYINLDDGVKADAEGLRARLEDGILRIELPKLREEEWTDVKKVPVE